MKFSILLYGFYMLMRFTAWRHQSFKTRLNERDFTMTIKTRDGSRSRSFAARGGVVSSTNGVPDASDFALVWSDAGAGFRYLTAMKLGALMKAVKNGSLKLEGDAAALTWFLETFKILLGYYVKAFR